jgi:hypothetical protein
MFVNSTGNLTQAREQAQKNANWTGVPWVVFTDTSGNTCIEKVQWAPGEVIEIIYPEDKK